MKSLERKAPMRTAARYAIGALFGCVLIFGPGVTLHSTSTPSISFALSPAPMVLGLTFSKAHADSKRRKRTRNRKTAQRQAEEKSREEAEKILQGTGRATLPANCAYDSYASLSSTSDIHVCGGNYYQSYEENGVTGFLGHSVGMDRGEIKRAIARKAKAEEKRKAEVKKKLQATRKASLSTDCEYDSFASFSTTSNVYICGGVQFRQFQENGVTGYERHTVGSKPGATKEAKERRVKAETKRRAEAKKKQQETRRANLPKGCAYDTYASFFSSSNVYACNGVRYRRYDEKGVTGYEVLDL
jgi:galactitol-specific phosphotransferase system IIB component